MTENTDAKDLRECPQCRELIKKKAIRCKHCKGDITDQDAQGDKSALPKSPSDNQVANSVTPTSPTAEAEDTLPELEQHLLKNAAAPRDSASKINVASASQILALSDERCAIQQAQRQPQPSEQSKLDKQSGIARGSKGQLEDNTKKCPRCGEVIKAKVCKLCNKKFEETSLWIIVIGGLVALAIWMLGGTGKESKDATDVYTVPKGGFLYRSWEACDAMKRCNIARFNELGGGNEGVTCLYGGAKVKVLQTMGGDISYALVRVISGRQILPTASADGMEGWIASGELTQAPQPADQLKSRFDSLSRGLDGISMENPVYTGSSEFTCNIADGVDMYGHFDDTGRITSVELKMWQEYHGDDSVIATRRKRWTLAVPCLIRAFDPSITQGRAHALLVELGILSDDGQIMALTNVDKHAREGDFDYAANNRICSFEVTRRAPQGVASSSPSSTSSPSTATEPSYNQNPSVQPSSPGVPAAETSSITLRNLSITSSGGIPRISGEVWNPTDNSVNSLIMKVELYDTSDSRVLWSKDVRMIDQFVPPLGGHESKSFEVVSDEPARNDGTAEFRVYLDGNLYKEYPIGEKRTAGRIDDTSAAANASSATASINQMLQAKKEGSDDLLNRAQADLAAMPKPSPGDSIEATRLNKLGLKELRAKNYPQAGGCFSAAIQADPSDAKLLSNLGYAELYSADLDSAQKHLYSSIALDSSRGVAWGDLGLVYAKQGKQDDAVSAFLVGYKVSNGKTLSFLQCLAKDDDPVFRQAGIATMEKLPASVQNIPANSGGSGSIDTSRL